LARDVVKAAMVESLAKRAGARVVSADGVGDGDDPSAQLTRTFVDAFAAYERAFIRSRTKAALGERISGGVPYGLMLADDGKRMVQSVIARAWELRARGLLLRAIAGELTASGIRPRSGATW
jgi:DNA invertase Pin-like site-specific DNA recombinase